MHNRRRQQQQQEQQEQQQQHQQEQRSLTQEEIVVQCNKEYLYVKREQTIGIKPEDYLRSNAYYGNRQRLHTLVTKLRTGTQKVTVVTCGGSITIGHGVKPKETRYANCFINFLNTNYPLKKRRIIIIIMNNNIYYQ
jgi:hypothetical protein